MNTDLRRDLVEALERPHRLGTIGGDLEEQLAHCASFSSVLAELSVADDARGIDLGTGGGLPGVALAALRPMMQWTLVDMRAARADEVERTILRLRLAERVQVVSAEAQRLAHDQDHREMYDVAVARAFGKPSITAECAAGVVAVDGFLVVSEPPQDDADLSDDRWSEVGLQLLGFGSPRFHLVDGYRYASFQKLSPTPDHCPRLPPRATRGWLQEP